MRSIFYKKFEDSIDTRYYMVLPAKGVILALSRNGLEVLEVLDFETHVTELDLLPKLRKIDFNHQLNEYYVSEKFEIDINGTTYITETNHPTLEAIYEKDVKVFHNGVAWEASPLGGHWPKVFLSRKIKTEQGAKNIVKWVDVKYIRILVIKRF